MSSKRPLYLFGVVFLSIGMSLPQLAFLSIEGSRVAQDSLLIGRFDWNQIRGLRLGVSPYLGRLSRAEFWQDRFIYSNQSSKTPQSQGWDLTVWSLDPETGELVDLGWKVPADHRRVPTVIGDELWLANSSINGEPPWTIESMQQEAFKLIDGDWHPSPFPSYVSKSANPWVERQWISLNRNPALIESTDDGILVSSMKDGRWDTGRFVVLPSSNRTWTIGGTPISFNGARSIRVLTSGNQLHTFIESDGRILYRAGFDLWPESTTMLVHNPLKHRDVAQFNPIKECASALRVANADTELAPWSLVRAEISESMFWRDQPTAMLIDGQPAVMIVDGLKTTNPMGNVYRFDGQTWSMFATQPLPLGAVHFRTVTCHDGQKSYVVVTTTMGKESLYSVDGHGIRPTAAKLKRIFSFPPLYIECLMLALSPAALLTYGLLFGGGIWFLMRWYTTRNYEFGNQSVKLASLGRRSLARLIDITLVILTTALLGWVMTQGFDWDAFAEAFARNVDHPTIHTAQNVAIPLGLWIVASVIAIILMQGLWGITPGKWCCGLRALRTTLRPCGIARSLLREIFLAFDSCGFFCWAPGIACIALTQNRQRLGDLLADTIVVETTRT
ncbi:RDD family protein [Schlesneria paludicola]|uniref:RDD family protein n=1 Tax=Schlesneria paludicola TaxID=360056 RepID=UPI00029A4F62|nr:RDD family protein [Schlesneria paludicola]